MFQGFNVSIERFSFNNNEVINKKENVYSNIIKGSHFYFEIIHLNLNWYNKKDVT